MEKLRNFVNATELRNVNSAMKDVAVVLCGKWLAIGVTTHMKVTFYLDIPTHSAYGFHHYHIPPLPQIFKHASVECGLDPPQTSRLNLVLRPLIIIIIIILLVVVSRCARQSVVSIGELFGINSHLFSVLYGLPIFTLTSYLLYEVNCTLVKTQHHNRSF